MLRELAPVAQAEAIQNIETMLPNDKPRQYHSDNVRNTKLIQQYRSKQYNEEYKEEYPCRVCYRKCQTEIEPVHTQ